MRLARLSGALLAIPLLLSMGSSRAATQPTFQPAAIISTPAPAEISAKIAPVLGNLSADDLPKRITAMREIQEGWLRDWQNKRLTAAQFHEYRYFSDRALIEAVAALPSAERSKAQEALFAFAADAVEWSDLLGDPTIGLHLAARAGLIDPNNIKALMQPRYFGVLRKISELFDRLPVVAEEQKIMGNVMIVMGAPSAFMSLNTDAISIVAHAARTTLELNASAKTPLLSPDQAKQLASILMFSAALLPGPDRVELTKFAAAYGGTAADLFPYADAIAASFDGNWIKADEVITKLLTGKDSASFLSPLGIPAGSGGVFSLMGSRQMALGEGAAIKVILNKPDEAMTLFEKSRSESLTKRQAADPVAAERQVMQNGETLVQVASGWIGTFAVVSRMTNGKIRRTVSFEPQSGGFSLISNYLHMDEGQQFLPGGVMIAYTLMRAIPRRGESPLLNTYVDELNGRTERLVGEVLRKALTEAGAKSGERVTIILPAALAMFPVAGSHASGEMSLGERYELRFALSLEHAAQTAHPAGDFTKIGFLSSSTSGLAGV